MADTDTYPAAVPVKAAENITTDAVLWYNVGIYGKLGYGVPNPSDDIGSLNPNMIDFSNLIGKTLFTIMHHEDVDMTTPPTIDTLFRIHQLYKRSRQIVAARTRAWNEFALETQHVSPSGEVFRVWPVPFFQVRNSHMKRWARWTMMVLSEIFQHTQNRRQTETYPNVGERIGGYLDRIYYEMATEMFGKKPADAKVEGFLLSEEDFNAYDPAKWFTETEMVDTVPALDNVFTEDRKAKLAAGVPLHELPKLEPYPANLIALYEQMRLQREGKINPDTGQAGDAGSRIAEVPPFPTTTRFI